MEDNPLLLFVVGKKVLVFDVEDIKRLRSLGIPGILLGTLPKYPQQNLFLSKPLQLSIYESIWLVINGHGVLVDNFNYNDELLIQKKISLRDNIVDNQVLTHDSESQNKDLGLKHAISLEEFLSRNINSPENLRRMVKNYIKFSHLRDSGYFIASGLKFGGEFMCYPGDPLRFHSHLIVTMKENISGYDIIAGGRLATGVKKLWVIMGEAASDASEEKKELRENEREVQEENQSEAQKGLVGIDTEIQQLTGNVYSDTPLTNSLSEETSKLSEAFTVPKVMSFSIEWAGFG